MKHYYLSLLRGATAHIALRILGVPPQVSIRMQFCALEDAHDFLLEAKALPAIASASVRMHLCLRACILLSWVGLEDGLDYATEHWGTRGRTLKALPTRLKVRSLAFLLPLSEPLLVDKEFDRLRKMRDRLAHPRANEPAPQLSIEDAEQTFQFCLKLLRALNTYRIANRIRDGRGRFATSPAATIDLHKLPAVRERKLAAVSAVSRKAASQ